MEYICSGSVWQGCNHGHNKKDNENRYRRIQRYVKTRGCSCLVDEKRETRNETRQASKRLEIETLEEMRIEKSGMMLGCRGLTAPVAFFETSGKRVAM
jgi:hypothetical protein